MTIKQLGGVFGRNPTFNDVTIEGQLTFDGDIDINSDLTVDGTLKADDLRLGSIAPSYNVLSSARNAGGSFEWGHANSSGYPSTMGAESGSGSPYMAFNAGPGTTSNTYKTLGILGTVIKTDTSGNLRIGRLTTASADNQTPVESAVFTNNGNLQFPSGQGIDFSPTAGTGTSELFDDYEEGVWTVNYAPTTGAFTTITTVGTGRYTKVGRLVTVFGSVYTSGALDVTGASGNLKITGLPYTCNATVAGGGADISHQSWNLGTDILNTRMYVGIGASEILMYKNTMNGSSFPSGNITVADMSTSGGSFSNLITFTASYEV